MLLCLLCDDIENLGAGVIARGGICSELVGVGDDGHLTCKRVVHIHQRAYVAENDAGSLELCSVGSCVELLNNSRSGGEDGRDRDLASAVLLERLADILGPLNELIVGEVRTSDEAELRSCVLVFPHDGIVDS